MRKINGYFLKTIYFLIFRIFDQKSLQNDRDNCDILLILECVKIRLIKAVANKYKST